MRAGRREYTATRSAVSTSTTSPSSPSRPAACSSSAVKERISMLTQSTSPRRANTIAALGLVFLTLLAALSLPDVGAAPPAPAVLEGSVTWPDSPVQITNGGRADFPWVAVDGTNISHIIYETGGAVWYTN